MPRPEFCTRQWITPLLVMMVMATSASAITITAQPGFASSTPGMDWHSVEISGDGIGDQQNAGSPNLVVGTLPNGNLCRAHWIFDVDDSINPADVVSATLNLRLKALINGPAEIVSLFHGQASTAGGDDISNGTQRAQAFADASFVDTGLDVADPASAVGVFYSFDVTSYVIDDLINDVGGVYSSFQARMDNADMFGDIPADVRYLFNSGDDADPMLRPFLEVTLIPEPASLALMMLGGVLVLRRR